MEFRAGIQQESHAVLVVAGESVQGYLTENPGTLLALQVTAIRVIPTFKVRLEADKLPQGLQKQKRFAFIFSVIKMAFAIQVLT